MMLFWFCWVASFVITAGLRVVEPGNSQKAELLSKSTGLSSKSAGRGDFSRSCAPYPDQRVVLVTVNYNYLDLFKNWLHYAKKHLKDTERLVVMPEDSAVLPALETMRKSSDVAFVVAEPGADKPAAASASGNSMEVPKAIEYGSKDYGKLVWRRPSYILKLLKSGCTVLYVDIDTVWIKDPFLDLGEKPGHDLHLVPDEVDKGRADPRYLCTCFMYMQPTRPIKKLIALWSGSWNGRATKNQFVFNGVLKAMKSTVDFAVLPIESFPPGVSAHNYPNASVVHANWVSGHDAKLCFMKRRGLWAEDTRGDLESCKDAKP